MKKYKMLIIILVSVLTPLLVVADGGNTSTPVAEGLAVIDPVRERSCISLRVDVPTGKALSGIQWFNGANDCSPHLIGPNFYQKIMRRFDKQKDTMSQESDFQRTFFPLPLFKGAGQDSGISPSFDVPYPIAFPYFCNTKGCLLFL